MIKHRLPALRQASCRRAVSAGQPLPLNAQRNRVRPGRDRRPDLRPLPRKRCPDLRLGGAVGQTGFLQLKLLNAAKPRQTLAVLRNRLPQVRLLETAHRHEPHDRRHHSRAPPIAEAALRSAPPAAAGIRAPARATGSPTVPTSMVMSRGSATATVAPLPASADAVSS